MPWRLQRPRRNTYSQILSTNHSKANNSCLLLTILSLPPVSRFVSRIVISHNDKISNEVLNTTRSKESKITNVTKLLCTKVFAEIKSIIVLISIHTKFEPNYTCNYYADAWYCVAISECKTATRLQIQSTRFYIYILSTPAQRHHIRHTFANIICCRSCVFVWCNNT